MSNVVSHLTASNGRKYGITRAEQYDFSDDGASFRGFIYKGIPMTQHYSHGEVYLTVRTDYLESNYTWQEWSNTAEHRLEYEFNRGGSSVDLEKLISNLEKIISKHNELNESATFSEEQEKAVRAEIQKEIGMIESAMERAKSDITWYNLSVYDFRRASEIMKRLPNVIAKGQAYLERLSELPLKHRKELYEKLINGLNDLLRCSYDIQTLEELINK